MIKRIIDYFINPQKYRIDDLDKAVDALIETAQYIAPEKRFKAIKIFVETLFKDYCVYKSRKKANGAVSGIPVYPVQDSSCTTCIPANGEHAPECIHTKRVIKEYYEL